MTAGIVEGAIAGISGLWGVYRKGFESVEKDCWGWSQTAGDRGGGRGLGTKSEGNCIVSGDGRRPLGGPHRNVSDAL